METLTLTLTFAIITAFSQATSTLVTRTQPQINLSSMLNHSQQHISETRRNDGRGRNHDCDYLITIKTSCDSPTYTKDKIGLSFGDAYGDEHYIPRVKDYIPRVNDSSDSEPFKKCNTFSFNLPGLCISKICKLYLFRKGSNGWVPETVVVYDYKYPPVIFNYNFSLSDGRAGTGYNYCPQP
ncbi:hypothetical protein P8452_58464 [Trifolium repens]|nr:embryo-specific protein ATS3B [Trifolium repens]WJX74860.1 hypothetical protein P8452_58464 [Trifolium repens]